MTSLCTKRFAMLLLIVAALPLTAQTARRRAAAPSVPVTVVRGKVTDADTNTPVAFAVITNGPRSGRADAQGNYAVQVPLGLTSVIIASRTGYESSTVQVVGRDNLSVNFTLKGKPTTSVRLTNGTTYQLDTETVQFAQEVPFSSTARSDSALVCNSDASKTTLNKSEIAKITGPGTLVTNSACCAATPVVRLTVDLKSGEHRDVLLAETCTGVFMDIAGQDHTTGQFIFARFGDIQEVVFP